MGAATGLVGAGREHETRVPDVETSSPGYATRFAGPVGRWFLEVQTSRALALIAAAASGPLTVLEVGGGHGQLTGALVAAGHRVVVHGSRGACHRGPGGRERVDRVISDLWQLPFGPRSFDLVVGVRLLAHVQAWRELLAEMGRVAARLVLIDFPARGALHRLAPRLFGAKRWVEANTRPYFGYDVGEVEQAFGAAGFRALGVARQFGLPMALHRLAGRPGLSRRLERGAAALGFTRRAGSPILLLAARDERGSAR
jgi:SAM-dependent methyltransferase